MKVKYDLHIHSALSPCSSELMTPNNIMNMCMLKGLNLVAVVDHNSSFQQDTLTTISESYDFLYIQGIEISCFEGFHLVSYFDSLDRCKEFFSEIEIYYNKMKLSSNPKNQIIYDEYDQESGYVNYDLHQKINLPTKELFRIIRSYEGIIVLAHIDRKNTGITNFDINIEELDFDGFEVDDKNNLINIYNQYPFLKKYKILKNSDSHDITRINENEYIDLDELSFEGLKAWLKYV